MNFTLNPSGTDIFTLGTGRTGTVNSVISGAGGLVESGGTGTLVLAATNTYAGTTTVGSGTLFVTGALGTNTVTVATGSTLGGSGSIGGATTVQAGGTVQGGDGTGSGTLADGTLNLGNIAGATTYSRFNIAAGGKISATTLNVTGTNVINILDNSLTTGTNTLITYTGAIGGSGFAGFKLGTVPAGMFSVLRNTGSAVQLVVTPLVTPVLTNAVTFGAGRFSLSFGGGNGQSYRVLASTNLTLPLTNWLVLTNGTFGAGLVNFTDSAATNARKFYRIGSP